MNFEITGRHEHVSDAVKDYVRDRLDHALRHADDVTSVHVILDHEKARHIAEVIVHGRRLSMTVHADSDDVHAAIDRCAEKLKHQLEHHHGRMRDRRRRGPSLKEAEAAALAAEAAAAAGAHASEELETRIITMSSGDLDPMTVEDARMELENGNKDFLVFREATSELVQVLFWRPDGHMGLIEIEIG